MRTPLTSPTRSWLLVPACLLICPFSTAAAADWCKYEKDFELTLNLSGSDLLAVSAAAGDLDIRGKPGTDEAVIHGRLCVSKEQWLEQSEIETSTGQRAEIYVNLPDTNGGWSLFGSNYAWMDLEIEVPRDMPMDVRDSSGDVSIQNVASVDLRDSSGDIEIEGVNGSVSISDSSGDIDVEQVGGDFTIESDSSGDIRADEIKGSALVKKDSSGDIRVRHVGKNFIVEADSSGDVIADDIGGDFSVLKDGSGDIHSIDVRGNVQIPD